MSTVGNLPSHVTTLMQAANNRANTENQVAIAVVAKQQQAMKQSGEAMVAMLEQMVDVQAQLAKGNLDVRA